METFIAIALIVGALIFFSKQLPEQTPEAVEEHKRKEFGMLSLNYICPHCQTKGKVRTMPVKRKKGVSGAKLTGAAFTLGLSIIATGLSRKEGLTQAHCENCGSTWDF
jgi:hypothetical protein